MHQRHKRHTSLVDRWVIILPVQSAFSDSVEAGLWRKHGPSLLILAVSGAAVFLAQAISMGTWLTRRLKFTVEDEIAAVYSGSKKNTGIRRAHGQAAVSVPIRRWASSCCPSCFCHQLQLILCSVLAGRYARRSP